MKKIIHDITNKISIIHGKSILASNKDPNNKQVESIKQNAEILINLIKELRLEYETLNK